MEDRATYRQRQQIAITPQQELVEWWILLDSFWWPEGLPDKESPLKVQGSRREAVKVLIEAVIGRKGSETKRIRRGGYE